MKVSKRDMDRRLKRAAEALAAELGDALTKRAKLEIEITKLAADLEAANREVAAYPTRLYWSRLSDKRLPDEVIWNITRHYNIASALYTHRLPSTKLLIDPRLLPALHVKHCLASRTLKKLRAPLKHWMMTNWHGGWEKQPKWKRYTVEPDLRRMAAHYVSHTFTAGPVKMTTLGAEGIIEFDVPDPDATLKTVGRVEGYHLKRIGDKLVVPYAPLPEFLEVRCGGRRGRQRLVICLK